MVKLEALLEDTKESGGAAQKEEAMKKIYQKLLAYDVLAKVVFEHCPAPVTARRLSLLDLYSCIPHAPYQEHLLIKKQQEEKVKTAAQVPSEPNLDDSSPFLC